AGIGGGSGGATAARGAALLLLGRGRVLRGPGDRSLRMLGSCAHARSSVLRGALDAVAPTVSWCAHSSLPGKQLEGAGRTVGRGARRSAGVERRFQLLGVHDRVRVALLGEEPLAVGREVL